jgi:hypothetical protein
MSIIVFMLAIDSAMQMNKKKALTYSTIKPTKPLSRPFSLGTTNSYYASSILLLSNKEPTYVALISNLEYISISFLHVRALCLVLL